jgi:hypothetical protein
MKIEEHEVVDNQKFILILVSEDVNQLNVKQRQQSKRKLIVKIWTSKKKELTPYGTRPHIHTPQVEKLQWVVVMRETEKHQVCELSSQL